MSRLVLKRSLAARGRTRSVFFEFNFTILFGVPREETRSALLDSGRLMPASRFRPVHRFGRRPRRRDRHHRHARPRRRRHSRFPTRPRPRRSSRRSDRSPAGRPDHPRHRSTSSRASTSTTDAYGSSGGNIRIRGFDGNRISLTFDGIPLNDSGNYAIFSNQQLDPELIEQVNVSLGVTDVDSPTASAAGGTINYRTRHADRRHGRPPVGLGGRLRLTGASSAMFNTGESVRGAPRPGSRPAMPRTTSSRASARSTSSSTTAEIYQPIGTQRRLRLPRRPLQPEPQQLLSQPVDHRPAYRYSARLKSRRTRPRRSIRRSELAISTTLAGARPSSTTRGLENDADLRQQQPHVQRAAATIYQRPHQPLEHGQHPRPVALHADATAADPDGRSELPVCPRQRRRHLHACVRTDARAQGFADRPAPASTTTATATSRTPSASSRRTSPTPTATA